MSNPYGWGQNEPQIKPKEQGGDSIATFSQKIYNLFDNLFNTLNSHPWSTATQSDAGYMSAADKAALDDVPNTYLPLSGGRLTGTIVASTHPALSRHNDNSYLTLCGGSTNTISNGAIMYLYGAGSGQPGAFRIYTGVNSHNLFGQSDGTLTWDGSQIATVADMPLSSTLSAYPYKFVCKLPNGLMLEGGTISEVTDANSRVTWTYPEAFYESPSVSVLKSDAAMSLNWYSLSNTRIILRVNNMSGSTIGQGMGVIASFIALGRWK